MTVCTALLALVESTEKQNVSRCCASAVTAARPLQRGAWPAVARSPCATPNPTVARGDIKAAMSAINGA